jgi:rhodanese-related sulfurtransferase
MKQQYRRIFNIPNIFLPLLLLILLISCNKVKNQDGLHQPIIETQLLLDYLSEHGNLINSPDIPTMIAPEDVFSKLSGHNQLVIDLRPEDEYHDGHIAHSVNISSSDILHYFEQTIDPNAFEKIVLVCPNAMLSGYVTAVLQFLGYNNVVFLRNGLSSWDMEIAEKYWLAAMSSHMEGKLETTLHPKNKPGEFPALHTGKTNAYDILRARAADILDVQLESTVIDADVVLEEPSNYYIINYWPDSLYQQGHIAGSIQYEPKASLGKGQFLNTLPTDKPVVLYCYTAHHSVYPVAYLRLLGYDAYHIPYGVNAFIQQSMLDTQPPRRSFVPDMVKNYPLSGTEGQNDTMTPETKIKTETISVQGGC